MSTFLEFCQPIKYDLYVNKGLLRWSLVLQCVTELFEVFHPVTDICSEALLTPLTVLSLTLEVVSHGSS